MGSGERGGERGGRWGEEKRWGDGARWGEGERWGGGREVSGKEAGHVFLPRLQRRSPSPTHLQ